MPRLKSKQDSNSAQQFIPTSLDKRLGYINDKRTRRKKLLRKRAMLSKCTNHREGPWTLEQNEIYLKFLEQNLKDFQTEYLRRCRKVFNRLSEYLPQRTSEQCRSHHQKLQKQIGSQNPVLIIEYVKMRIDEKQSKVESKKQRGTEGDKINQLQQNGFSYEENSKKLKLVLNLDFLGLW